MGAEAVFIVSEVCVRVQGADKRDEKRSRFYAASRGPRRVRRAAHPHHFRVFPWPEINVIERMAPMKGI